MIAFGYTRISSEEQARQGLSLEMQAQRIAAFCAAHGWDLRETFSEEGFSGAKRDRPGLLASTAAKPWPH